MHGTWKIVLDIPKALRKKYFLNNKADVKLLKKVSNHKYFEITIGRLTHIM
jgi:hypothetical protein